MIEAKVTKLQYHKVTGSNKKLKFFVSCMAFFFVFLGVNINSYAK